MTSRVEELQRMCDNINENGGLDSGEWHTALLTQIAQNLAVIADVMMADRKTENSSEKPNNCEHITEDGVTCAKYPACDDCLDNPLNKVKGSERLVKGSEQTDCEACELDGKADVCKVCRVSNYEPQTDCPWK